MKTSVQILPGIKSIAFVECRLLPDNIGLHGITRNAVGIFAELQPVAFFDSPECTCTTEKKNGSYQDTASLKFSSGQWLPLRRKLAFVVTDVSGRNFVIGAKESPFPVIKVEEHKGSPSGESAAYSYEITHVALKSLVPCVI